MSGCQTPPQVEGRCVYSDLGEQRVHGVMSGCQTPPQVEGQSCLQWSEGTESAWGDVRLSDTTPGRGAVMSTVIWGNRECMGWCQAVSLHAPGRGMFYFEYILLESQSHIRQLKHLLAEVRTKQNTYPCKQRWCSNIARILPKYLEEKTMKRWLYNFVMLMYQYIIMITLLSGLHLVQKIQKFNYFKTWMKKIVKLEICVS